VQRVPQKNNKIAPPKVISDIDATVLINVKNDDI